MTNDRKLALSIAAVLLVGFTAVAVLSTGSGEPEPPAVSAGTFEDGVSSEPIDRAAVTSVPEAGAVTLVPDVKPVSAGTPQEAEEFQVEPGVNYLARGIEAFQSGSFDHSIAYLMAEVEERPDRPYSQYLLGLSLWRGGRLDEAAEAMDRSAELDGTSIKTFVNLSRIHNDRGDYDAALTASRKALEIDPGDPTALFVEGRSLFNQGETGPAVESLRHSLAIDPDNGYVWNMLGLTLLGDGSDEGALEAFTRASEIEPEVPYIQNNLGMALERNGRWDEAVAAYRRAVDLGPDRAKSVSNLARLEPTVFTPEESEDVGVVVAVETTSEEPEPPSVSRDDGSE